MHEPSPELLNALELLAAEHAGANDPFEPYQGVAALFNADLHRREPSFAPREHWTVESSGRVIRHVPIAEILQNQGGDIQ
jgi:hypothetical protein